MLVLLFFYEMKILPLSLKARIWSLYEACMYLKQAFSTHFCPLTCESQCVRRLPCVSFMFSTLCEWPCLYVHRFWMKRSTLWHPCSQEGNSACCDSSVQYGCTHCNCIPSNALNHTFYITCNFMDILIATNYLCLGLLQYGSFQCIFYLFFIPIMLFLLWLSNCSTKLM